MNDIANGRGGPMLNPPHLIELVREGMDDVGLNVTETAVRLGCECGTLSHLLNGKAGAAANMVLDEIGWGTAEHRMRMQASNELAQARPRPDHRRASCEGSARIRLGESMGLELSRRLGRSSRGERLTETCCETCEGKYET